MQRLTLLLIMALMATSCWARYEDGYRGGSKRSRYSSESEEDESDELLEHQAPRPGDYDERVYKYESSESDEKPDVVHFNKRRLQHYAVHAEEEEEEDNRIPENHVEHHNGNEIHNRYHGYHEHRPERYQPTTQQPPPEKKQKSGHSWKHDRETWSPLPPLRIPPPEKPHKDFVPTEERPEPPPPSEAARMARYIVHNADWTTVATISTLPKIKGFPFAMAVSMSDGPVEAGSGIPYLFLTPLDMTQHDLASDRRCSLTMTLAETDYCKQKKLDPEDPRCARVTITGEMWKLKNGTIGAKKAEEALFSRHPVMKTWPKDHGFFFATLKMEHIVLMDYFGGPKYISIRDYLRATPTSS